MPPEFWENLPGILKEFGVMSIAVVTAIGLFWQQRRGEKKVAQIPAALSEQTEVLVKKVDSAAKEVKQEAANVGIVTAKKAKEAAEVAAQGTADNAQIIVDGIARILADKLNGTLIEHGQRLAVVEKRIDNVEGKQDRILQKLGDPVPPDQIRERM